MRLTRLVGQGFRNLEDFELDTSESGGPKISGRDDAIKMIRTSLEGARTAHQVHSPEIEIDGDTAKAVWAMQDRVIWTADRPSLVGYGHYTETYRREGGEWKIATSKLGRLIVEFLPAGASEVR